MACKYGYDIIVRILLSCCDMSSKGFGEQTATNSRLDKSTDVTGTGNVNMDKFMTSKSYLKVQDHASESESLSLNLDSNEESSMTTGLDVNSTSSGYLGRRKLPTKGVESPSLTTSPSDETLPNHSAKSATKTLLGQASQSFSLSGPGPVISRLNTTNNINSNHCKDLDSQEIQIESESADQ